MPDVNIITTNLPDYVQTNRDVLVKSFVLPEGGTIARMRKQTGVKKDAAINLLDISPEIVAGAGCVYEPSGSVELTQRVIETGQFVINLDICPETLRGKYAEYLLRSNANGSDLPFEEYLIEGIRANVAEQLETIVWQSDTDNSGIIDGLLKIATDDADVIDVPITAGASAYAGILEVYNSLPEYVLVKGGTIFVGPAIFRAFIQEIVAANLYHFAVGNEDIREIFLPGTNVKVVKTYGLYNTLFILGTYEDNLYYGTDLESDREVVKVVKDEKTDAYSLIVKWNSGVQFAFPEFVVLGEFASAPVSPIPAGAQLAAIAEGVNALADEDHVFKTEEQTP